MAIIFGKREPWIHVCGCCGGEFMGASLNAAWCPTCRKQKRAEQKKAYRQSENGRLLTNAGYRRYYAAHREEQIERSRRSYRENRESRLEHMAKYREAHRELIMLKQRARRGDANAGFELAKREGRLHTCRRLHLTALTLPCGQVAGACTKNCPDRMKEAG